MEKPREEEFDREIFRALNEMSAAEYILAVELVEGKRDVSVLIEMANEICNDFAMHPDFVVCLANGTGHDLPKLRSQALDELRGEFPKVGVFLEAIYGEHVRLQTTFSAN